MDIWNKMIISTPVREPASHNDCQVRWDQLTLAEPQNPKLWADGKHLSDIFLEVTAEVTTDAQRKKVSHEVKKNLSPLYLPLCFLPIANLLLPPPPSFLTGA